MIGSLIGWMVVAYPGVAGGPVVTDIYVCGEDLNGQAGRARRRLLREQPARVAGPGSRGYRRLG
jgi:hypothetical protein